MVHRTRDLLRLDDRVTKVSGTNGESGPFPPLKCVPTYTCVYGLSTEKIGLVLIVRPTEKEILCLLVS